MMNRTPAVHESKRQSILAWIEVAGNKVEKLTDLKDGVICYKLINTLAANIVDGKSKRPKAEPVNRVKKKSKRRNSEPLKDEVEKKLDYGVDEPLDQEKEEEEVGYLNDEPIKQDAVENNEIPMECSPVSKEIPSESMDLVNGECSNDSQKTVEAEPYELSNNVNDWVVENNSINAEKDEIVQENCVQVSSILTQMKDIHRVTDSVQENIGAFNNSENIDELTPEQRYEVITRFIENILSLNSKNLVDYGDCKEGNEMEIAKMTTLLLSAMVQYAISARQPQILQSFYCLTEDNQEQIKEFLDVFLNVTKETPKKDYLEKILSHTARPKRNCQNPSQVVPQVTPQTKKYSKKVARKSSVNECFDTPIKKFLNSPDIRKTTPDLKDRVLNALRFRDKRLYELEDRLDEKKDSITDLENQIKALKSKYAELDNKHKSLKADHNVCQIKSEEENTTFENKIREKDEKIKSMKREIEELNGHINYIRNKDGDDLTKSSGKSSSLKTDLESLMRQLYEIIRKQKENRTSDELPVYDENVLKTLITEYCERLQNKDKEIEALQGKKDKETEALLSEKQKEIDALRENKDKEIKVLEEIIEFEKQKMNEKVNNLRDLYEAAKNRADKIDKKIYEEILKDKDQALNHLQADFVKLQSEKEKLERTILQSPLKNIEDMRKDEMNKLNETIAELQTKNNLLEQNNDTLKEEKEECIRDLEKRLKSEIKRLEKSNKALTKQNLKLKCETDVLKETLLRQMRAIQSQVSQEKDSVWGEYSNSSANNNDSNFTVEPPVNINSLSSPVDHSNISRDGLRKSIQQKISVNAESSHGSKNGKLSCAENEFNEIKMLVQNLARCIRDINNQSNDVLAHIENIAMNLSGVKDLVQFLKCVTKVMSNYVHSNMLVKHKNKDPECINNCTLCEKNKDLINELNGQISKLSGEKKLFKEKVSRLVKELERQRKTFKEKLESNEKDYQEKESCIKKLHQTEENSLNKRILSLERKLKENKPVNCENCALLDEKLRKYKVSQHRFNRCLVDAENTQKKQKDEIFQLTKKLETATQEKTELQNKIDYIKRYEAATYDFAVLNSLADRIPCPLDPIPNFTEKSDKDTKRSTSVESAQSVVVSKSSKDKTQRFGNFWKVEDESEMLSQSSIASNYAEDRLKEYIRRNSMVPRDQMSHYPTELDMTQSEEKFHPPISTTNGKYIPCPKLKPNNSGWNFGQNESRARARQMQDNSTNSYKKFKVSENQSTAVTSRFTTSIYSKKPKPQLLNSTPKIKVPPRIIFSTKRKPKQV